VYRIGLSEVLLTTVTDATILAIELLGHNLGDIVEDKGNVYRRIHAKNCRPNSAWGKRHISQNNLFFSFSRDSIQQQKCDFVNVSFVHVSHVNG